MANSLGPALLGYFALAQIYARIVDDLLNVQTWESMIKFGAKSDEKENFANIIKTNLVIDLVSAFIAFLVAILMLRSVASWLEWDATLVEVALIYCFSIPFALTTFTVGIPRLFNRFADVVKINVVMAVVKLVMVAAISLSEGGLVSYVYAYLIVEVVISISLVILSIRILSQQGTVNWFRAKIKLNRDQISFLWWTNLRTVVRIPVRQLDILIINQIMSTNAAGIYKVYKEIVGIIGRLGEPVNQAIYPEYAKLIGNDRSQDSVGVTKNIMIILLAISIAALIGFLIFSEFVIGTFFGKEYLALMPAFYILVFLFCINLFLTPINSLFIAAGFARYSFFIVLGNNILYLTVAIVGGTFLGIYGIVLAFACQMVFNQGLKMWFLVKYSTSWGTVIR